MRVCHIISADLWAGAAVQVFETVRGLKAHGVEVSVAAFNDGLFGQRVEAEGVRCRILDEKRLGAAGIVRGLAGVIRDTNPECLHVHAYKEHILGSLASVAAGRGSLPMVRTFHGRTGVPQALPAWRRLKVAAVQFVERRLLAGATIVAVSQDLERYLRDRYPGARVVFVPNGVRVPVEACDGAQARARWNIPGDAFWVGAVARLEPVKNLPCLVRAAALLRDSLPGLRVSIFGEGAERPGLERRVAAEKLEDIVTLHGFTDDAAETVGGFDCFVLSSFHEGLPMSLLEAMARGVPPVCSRVGGMAELITHGRSGLLFESNDHVGLADCLRQVHDSKDAALRMGQAARALVAGSYSIEVTNTALLKVYQSVISGGGLAGPRSKAEARS